MIITRHVCFHFADQINDPFNMYHQMQNLTHIVTFKSHSKFPNNTGLWPCYYSCGWFISGCFLNDRLQLGPTYSTAWSHLVARCSWRSNGLSFQSCRQPGMNRAALMLCTQLVVQGCTCICATVNRIWRDSSSLAQACRLIFRLQTPDYIMADTDPGYTAGYPGDFHCQWGRGWFMGSTSSFSSCIKQAVCEYTLLTKMNVKTNVKRCI